jgi:uncharacterized protein
MVAADVIYEWDPVKTAANVKKHRVTFEEAASVFLDPTALTFWDPDHSEEEDREITIGRSTRQRVLLVALVAREGCIRNSMRKELAKRHDDDLRPSTISPA